jgi:hypothetical protein
VKVTDENDAKITLIHEAAHLADSTVDDHGYYASANFEALDEATKIANAAHFEELPARELGVSKFAGITFKPGVTASGAAVTRGDNIRRDIAQRLRMAWDAAVDTHSFIREVRVAYLDGNKAAFDDNRADIMEISEKMDLTIHEQTASEAIVTTLDVTTTESIARAMAILGATTKKAEFPSVFGIPKFWLTDLQLRDEMIESALDDTLLNDLARDKELIEWLVTHYRAVPSL